LSTDESLSGEEIRDAVLSNLEIYKDKSFFEQYAMYMGKAQILEFGLKRLHHRLHSVPLDDMEKWTMGRIKDELKKSGIRRDFMAFLKLVVERRNYIAHEMLVNNAMLASLVEMSARMEGKELWKAIYELEQIILLYDFCEEKQAWK
jgi:uncharacterized protein YydD (DUF2326 family)